MMDFLFVMLVCGKNVRMAKLACFFN